MQRDDNDNNDKEGGLHPTPLTTAMHELAARLRSAGILYALDRLEASLLDVDDTNGRRQRAMGHPRMMKRGIMSANNGLMPPTWLCIPSEFRQIPTEVGQKSPAIPEWSRNRHWNVL